MRQVGQDSVFELKKAPLVDTQMHFLAQESQNVVIYGCQSSKLLPNFYIAAILSRQPQPADTEVLKRIKESVNSITRIDLMKDADQKTCQQKIRQKF